MLFGTVEYGMKDGGSAAKDWGARAHLVKDGDDVKMDFYQVYLVSDFVYPPLQRFLHLNFRHRA